MTRLSMKGLVIGLLLCGTASLSLAGEAFLTAKYQPVAGGYRYFLTVQNNMATSTGSYINSIDMYTYALTGQDQESPAKWDASHIGPDFVAWATDEGAGEWADGIAPGESLSGFNVTLPGLVTKPGSSAHCLHYRLMWYNGTEGGGLFGDAYPELVPEPSALLALVAGMGALGLSTVRRRRAR